MSEATLFPVGEVQKSEASVEGCGGPRFLRPDRRQLALRPVELDSLLPADHCARAVLLWYALAHHVMGGLALEPMWSTAS